jgi:hypothetical protein
VISIAINTECERLVIAEAVAIKKGMKIPALTPCRRPRLTNANVDDYYNGSTTRSCRRWPRTPST